MLSFLSLLNSVSVLLLHCCSSSTRISFSWALRAKSSSASLPRKCIIINKNAEVCKNQIPKKNISSVSKWQILHTKTGMNEVSEWEYEWAYKWVFIFGQQPQHIRDRDTVRLRLRQEAMICEEVGDKQSPEGKKSRLVIHKKPMSAESEAWHLFLLLELFLSKSELHQRDHRNMKISLQTLYAQ